MILSVFNHRFIPYFSFLNKALYLSLNSNLKESTILNMSNRKSSISKFRKVSEFFSSDKTQEDEVVNPVLKKTKEQESSNTNPPQRLINNLQGSGDQQPQKVVVKLERKLCDNWFKDFPWLVKLESDGLSCKWCRQSDLNLDSPFGNSVGSFNYRRDALEDHQTL